MVSAKGLKDGSCTNGNSGQICTLEHFLLGLLIIASQCWEGLDDDADEKRLESFATTFLKNRWETMLLFGCFRSDAQTRIFYARLFKLLQHNTRWLIHRLNHPLIDSPLEDKCRRRWCISNQRILRELEQHSVSSSWVLFSSFFRVRRPLFLECLLHSICADQAFPFPCCILYGIWVSSNYMLEWGENVVVFRVWKLTWRITLKGMSSCRRDMAL